MRLLQADKTYSTTLTLNSGAGSVSVSFGEISATYSRDLENKFETLNISFLNDLSTSEEYLLDVEPTLGVSNRLLKLIIDLHLVHIT